MSKTSLKWKKHLVVSGLGVRVRVDFRVRVRVRVRVRIMGANPNLNPNSDHRQGLQMSRKGPLCWEINAQATWQRNLGMGRRSLTMQHG